MKRGFSVAIILCISFFTYGQTASGGQAGSAIPIAKVWSGHPVGFDLYTSDRYQYVCYYDSARNMVIAQRPLTSALWKTTVLPTTVGWDSHNYIRMELDKKGYIHVSGNMHNVPLIYFRSSAPESIESFARLPMTGKNEDRATYPVFFKDREGELYFQYRNGGSGQGITYWNKYDAEKQTWAGLFDTPFFDGEGEANAYMTDPKLGPDGYFYVVWMWRLTPTANTNHNLSCVRSKDLVHWENLRGDNISLPIRWRDNLPVVNPVGPWNGLINMGFGITWNKQNVPFIHYHKYDASGISQLYMARFEKSSDRTGNWVSYQLSRWPDFTWSLNLGGSLRNSIGITSVKHGTANDIAVNYMHEKYGTGTWLVDEGTMSVTKQVPLVEDKVSSALPPLRLQPGMMEQRKRDNSGHFIMQWQTLPHNQDRPREGPNPPPVQLMVYKVSQ